MGNLTLNEPRKPLKWYKGAPLANPRGRKAGSTGFQEPNVRIKHLLQTHGIDVMLKAMKDEKFLAKTFSAFDGMHIISLAKALKGDHQAYEHALNRMFGKVPDKQINLNLNIETDPDQLSERASALLGNLAGLGEEDSDLVES